MKKLFIVPVCMILSQFVSAQTTPTTIPADVQQVARSVRPAAIEAHMRYLADDKLAGRKPGTPGYELAAQYVENQFRTLGFKPAGQRGTYRQAVPLRKAQVREEASSMTVIQDGQKRALVYGKNFFLSPNFGLTISEVSAPVVFVGFGVSAPELGYDDYAGVDVRGKIVACFNGAPSTFPSNQRAYSGSVKQEVAAARGAVGLLTFSLPTDVNARIEPNAPRNRNGGPAIATYRWTDAKGQTQRTFPQLKVIASLGDSTARSLFVKAATSFELARQAANKSKPQSFPLNISVEARTSTLR